MGFPDRRSVVDELQSDPQTSRLRRYADFEEQDVRHFRLMPGPSRHFARGEVLRLQGDPVPDIYLLREGWLACSLAHDNGKRQITKIHLPGDLVGVPSFASEVAAETIHALSPATVGVIDPPAIGDVFRNHPRMAAFLFLSAQEERVLLMERLAAVGQTSALARIAGLILNLHDRIRLIEPTCVDTFPVPLSQEEVGDATGLTSVSVNVALKTLRTNAIAIWLKGTLRILNRAELERMTGYVPRPPRSLRWMDGTGE